MDMTTTKTIVVFAIIFGCFAILYPKIFHPMLQHAIGVSPEKQKMDDVLNRVPPHLRKGPGPARVLREEISQHMRPGPHPGLRAAAEMKKQAATTTGSGKGMMGVVLPMYAVGIVIYLIYTLTKVFGKKEEKKEDVLSNNPFSDIKYDPSKKEFKYSDGLNDSEDEKETAKPKAHQRDLERLLLRADERNIRYKQLCDQILSQSAKAVEDEGKPESRFTLLPPFRVYDHKNKAELEMRQLKERLLETEAQMSRILKAMETVSDKVITNDGADTGEAAPAPAARTVDSSPDMDTYEIINADRPASRGAPDGTVEDIGPVEAADKQQSAPKQDTSTVRKDESVAKTADRETDTSAMGSNGPVEGLGESLEKTGNDAAKIIENSNDKDARQHSTEKQKDDGTKVPPEPSEQKIPEKKHQKSQEPRPDLRKRNKGRRARKDN